MSTGTSDNTNENSSFIWKLIHGPQLFKRFPSVKSATGKKLQDIQDNESDIEVKFKSNRIELLSHNSSIPQTVWRKVNQIARGQEHTIELFLGEAHEEMLTRNGPQFHRVLTNDDSKIKWKLENGKIRVTGNLETLLPRVVSVEKHLRNIRTENFTMRIVQVPMTLVEKVLKFVYRKELEKFCVDLCDIKMNFDPDTALIAYALSGFGTDRQETKQYIKDLHDSVQVQHVNLGFVKDFQEKWTELQKQVSFVMSKVPNSRESLLICRQEDSDQICASMRGGSDSRSSESLPISAYFVSFFLFGRGREIFHELRMRNRVWMKISKPDMKIQITGTPDQLAQVKTELSEIQRSYQAKFTILDVPEKLVDKVFDSNLASQLSKNFFSTFWKLSAGEKDEEESKDQNPGSTLQCGERIHHTNVVNFQWSWEENQTNVKYGTKPGDWVPYDIDQNQQIENRYQRWVATRDESYNNRKIVGDFNQEKNQATYSINFAAMTQTRVETKWERSIKRKTLETTSKRGTVTTLTTSLPTSVVQPSSQWLVKISLRSPEILHDEVISHVEDIIRRRKRRILDTKLSEDVSEENLILLDQKLVKYSGKLARDGNDLVLIGHPLLIEKLEGKLVSWLTAIKTSLQVHIPDNWKQSSKSLLQLLDPKDTDYKMVEKQFNETIESTGRRVVSVHRVENRQLYERFALRQGQMRQRYNNDSDYGKDVMLYHGTNSTAPEKIWNGTEGFDMRFSNSGMWGQGIYFATKASYSDGYSFKKNDGTRQMFYSRVSLGHWKCLEPDQSLRMPPLKSPQDRTREGEMYDSVQGQTKGCIVYIVYLNDYAYPEFLITYK